jgi:hypothetical protein
MAVEDSSMIDLRSDTVTRPTLAMRAAMAAAPVGDDVWGDDPTVRQLEAMTAALLGKEAGLYVPSGTQSNLVALLTHCGRGDEYLVSQEAHTYKYEGGGAAALGSIQPQPLTPADDATIPLASLRAAIKPDDFHFARTRLLSLENTTGGRVLSQDYIAAAAALADEYRLGKHLDGARIFNAAVKLGIAAEEIAFPSILYRYVCRKDWVLRWVRYCAPRQPSSSRASAGARCSAAACARPASSRRRAFTHLNTISRGCRKITTTRRCWPLSCLRCRS